MQFADTTTLCITDINNLTQKMGKLDIQFRRDDNNNDINTQDEIEPSTPSTTTTDENDPQVYRFKLSPTVQDIVTSFAKVHQYDTRKDYKEAWKEWCENNSEMIDREVIRLTELGYDGDVLDKMYKAGRYYFRTKQTNSDKKPKKRRQYVSMDSNVITAMDEHIAANSGNDNYSPANGYSGFVESSQNLLLDEIKRLMSEHGNSLSAKDIQLKVKKTYKNRYYLYTRQQN